MILPLLVFGDRVQTGVYRALQSARITERTWPVSVFLRSSDRLESFLERHVHVDAFTLDIMRIADNRRLGTASWLTSADSTSAVPSR